MSAASLKRVVWPLALAAGAGAFVVVAGLTGFCPACQTVTNWLGLGAPPPASTATAPAVPAADAPGWTMQNLAGQPVASSSYAGQVVLVEFWSMTCPDCLEEIATLRELQKQFGARGFVVLGACLDTAQAGALPAFLKDHNIDYPIVMSNKAAVEALGGVKGTPTAVLLDRGGRIVSRFVGYTEPPALTAAVAAAVAASP